jgi:uncharacterized protein (DUF58 family)
MSLVALLGFVGPPSVVLPVATLVALFGIYFASFWAASPEQSLFPRYLTDDHENEDSTEESNADGGGDGGSADGAGDDSPGDADESTDEGDADASDDQPPATRIGPDWDPGTTVALLAGAGGILTRNTTMFLAGAVGFVYAAYRYGTSAPEVSVAVEREIADRSPLPSDEVDVTLTLENEGDEPIPDLRVVDGVPEQLAVVSGSPRFCTSLQPGEETAFSYAVRANRGSHEFGETRLVARNVSASAQREWAQAARLADAPDSETATITCQTQAEDVPLPADTAAHPGQITTDSGGEGVEFYATREYHPADPMSRIDWKRYAKTRELTTVEFRETRAATVLLVVDTRTPAHVSRRSGEPDAVELGRYAAERLAESFVRRNDRVGLALFGPDESYLPPGGGDEQLARVRAELDTASDLSDHGIGLFDAERRERASESRFETLRKRLPDGAQVLFVSPMADDYAAEVTKRFAAYGHAVTVVSPDVAESGTPGGTVERIERDRRLAELRGPVRVVDWSPDEPIRSAVSKATARWSG